MDFDKTMSFNFEKEKNAKLNDLVKEKFSSRIEI